MFGARRDFRPTALARSITRTGAAVAAKANPENAGFCPKKAGRNQQMVTKSDKHCLSLHGM
jgi:hypothetical protein